MNCKAEVLPLTNGSYRNHCPECLCSVHVDILPGDRNNTCLGLMKPIELDYNAKKGYVIVHQCEKCGAIKRNKCATDTIQKDNIVKFLKKF